MYELCWVIIGIGIGVFVWAPEKLSQAVKAIKQRVKNIAEG